MPWSGAAGPPQHERFDPMIQFTLPDMTCGHCVRTVTETVKQLDPEAQVAADLASHTVRIETRLPADQVAQALAEEGYQPA
jgi:copper chaperone